MIKYLIENMNTHEWFFEDDKKLGWTNDPNKAMKFDVYFQAENFIVLFFPIKLASISIPTEHIFTSKRTRQRR